MASSFPTTCLVTNGMSRTRGSLRFSGGFSPPKMGVPFAPGACTKISDPAPKCGAQEKRMSRISFDNSACQKQ